MSEAMTYDSLIQDVQDYAERDDTPFLDQIPRFVMLAENRIASEVRGLGYIRFVSGSLTAGDPTIEKPARWRETASFSVVYTGDVTYLSQRGYQYVRVFWPDATVQGLPRFYADYDYEHWHMAPTPDSAYTFEISYYERPAPLDSSNQTNWTTQYAPQLLLYATLLEAQPFLKLQERIAEFQSLYDRASAGVTAEAQRRLMGDAANMRMTG